MRCTSIFAAASLLLRFVLVQAAPLGEEFFREVDVRLEAPPAAQRYYAARVEAALAHAGLAPSKPQYFLVVDRSPRVQAALVYWYGDGAWELVGASPASTGKPGEFEHFLTPLGVFAHSLREDRVPTLFPGRFLVVVDSGRQTRPGWAKSVGR